jgi:hypothetical protein
VPYSSDSDNMGAVVHGIDHAVIAGADAQVRPMAGQRQETRRARISGQAVDDLSDRFAHGRVELPQRTAGARPDIDRVGGHVRQALQAELCLDLLPGDRLAGLIHGRVGLGNVLGVLSGSERLDD